MCRLDCYQPAISFSSFPLSFAMDPSEHFHEDSHSLNHRSRASSGVSTTRSLLNTLQLSSSPRGAQPLDLSGTQSSSASSQRTTSSPYISPELAVRHIQGFLPTPASQTSHAPFPQLSEDILNAAWFNVQTSQPSDQGPPLLKVDPVDEVPQNSNSSTSLPTPQSANMSAVASLNFDPMFDMGPRSSYSWSVLESGNNSGLLGHQLGHYGSEASLTPPSGTSSVTASPPRNMSAEQRELKRQQDQARRNSKNAARMRRAGSGSTYGQSPPVSLAELATPASLPVYTTGPTQISLLAEPPTSLTSAASYSLPTYSTSLPSDPQSQTVFSNPYQPQPYLQEYQPAYPTTTPPGLPSHYGLADSLLGDDFSQAATALTIPHSRVNLGTHDQQHRQQAPGLIYANAMSMMGPVPGSSPPHHSSAAHVQQQDAAHNVRVVGSRPKPQCWEHGCNGRQFSTFSNLLRHQREKSGQATKSVCPNCGAEFTRTTARNGHQQNDKCKARRST
ncbi:hypothetical protein ACKVWC_003835 [Pyricularia oryzae]